MDSCFSDGYFTARRKFIDAAQSGGAVLSRYEADAHGPHEALFTDTAWFGSPDAQQVFVVISGTHGVEGFFGSAVQIEFMRRKEMNRLSAGMAVLFMQSIRTGLRGCDATTKIMSI